MQAELRHFDGRLLLHQEGADGSVLATWESTRSEDVKTLRECMEGFYRSRALQYYRLVSSLSAEMVEVDVKTQ